jgi:hypothetical protein
MTALGFVQFRDTEQDSLIPGAQVELGARRGLVDDLDVGLKLYLLGIQSDVKWRLRNGPISVAIAPAFDLSRTRETAITTDAAHLFVHVPLLVSYPSSPRWTITTGPKLMYGLYWPKNGGHAQGLSVGGLLGAAFRFRGGRWRLLPEVDLYRSVAGEVPVRGWSFHTGAALARDF